jgi:Protein of unknown function (DUF3017)
MANRPANAGSDRGRAGAPPPVHHQGFARNPGTRPGPPPGHRARDAAARRTQTSRTQARTLASRTQTSRTLAGLPYLIVVAGVAVGLFVTWQGSPHAGLGTSLVGGALLTAAAARLLLPPRYTELLTSRWKAADVLAFTVLGTGVLAIALVLP